MNQSISCTLLIYQNSRLKMIFRYVQKSWDEPMNHMNTSHISIFPAENGLRYVQESWDESINQLHTSHISIFLAENDLGYIQESWDESINQMHTSHIPIQYSRLKIVLDMLRKAEMNQSISCTLITSISRAENGAPLLNLHQSTVYRYHTLGLSTHKH